MVKVLCPLDGSERSLAAMLKGLGYLSDAADITLLCVQHAGFENAPEDLVEMFDEDEDDEIFATSDAAQTMLDQAEAKAKEAGHKVATKVLEGNPRKAIVKEAKKYDLLIMHALDKGGLGEKFRMSNTEAIARKVGCSVLLVSD